MYVRMGVACFGEINKYRQYSLSNSINDWGSFLDRSDWFVADLSFYIESKRVISFQIIISIHIDNF